VDLHTASTFGELAAASLELIARVSHAEVVIFALTDTGAGRCAGAFWPDSCDLPRLMPVYERFWHENPLGTRSSLLNSEQTLRLEDVSEPDGLRRTGYYNEYLMPSALTNVMSGYMARRGRYRLALTAMRSGTDLTSGAFTTAERDAMELVRRHAVAAFWNFARLALLGGQPVSIYDLLESNLHTGMIIRDAASDDYRPRRIPPLTAAERVVLHWMCEGKTNPEIAIILGCATRTVYKHVEHILKKLGVENRTSAVVKAMGMRLLGENDGVPQRPAGRPRAVPGPDERSRQR
jgi:DNA-binding CsgD family transcriptional regulator